VAAGDQRPARPHHPHQQRRQALGEIPGADGSVRLPPQRGRPVPRAEAGHLRGRRRQGAFPRLPLPRARLLSTAGHLATMGFPARTATTLLLLAIAAGGPAAQDEGEATTPPYTIAPGLFDPGAPE